MGDYAAHLSLQRERTAALRASIEAAFPPGAPIALELGCGHGHWLTAFAEAHPDRAFLGLDLISHRIRRALAKKEKRGLDRLHFLKGEARELLTAWPADRVLADVFMLFPDPWPKARHHKHRMVQTALLDRLAELMPTGGRFCFRTDHPEYFEWTRQLVEAHPEWRIASSDAWPWETETVFQRLMDSWQSLVATRGPRPTTSR